MSASKPVSLTEMIAAKKAAAMKSQLSSDTVQQPQPPPPQVKKIPAPPIPAATTDGDETGEEEGEETEDNDKEDLEQDYDETDELPQSDVHAPPSSNGHQHPQPTEESEEEVKQEITVAKETVIVTPLPPAAVLPAKSKTSAGGGVAGILKTVIVKESVASAVAPVVTPVAEKAVVVPPKVVKIKVAAAATAPVTIVTAPTPVPVVTAVAPPPPIPESEQLQPTGVISMEGMESNEQAKEVKHEDGNHVVVATTETVTSKEPTPVPVSQSLKPKLSVVPAVAEKKSLSLKPNTTTTVKPVATTTATTTPAAVVAPVAPILVPASDIEFPAPRKVSASPTTLTHPEPMTVVATPATETTLANVKKLVKASTTVPSTIKISQVAIPASKVAGPAAATLPTAVVAVKKSKSLEPEDAEDKEDKDEDEDKKADESVAVAPATVKAKKTEAVKVKTNILDDTDDDMTMPVAPAPASPAVTTTTKSQKPVIPTAAFVPPTTTTTTAAMAVTLKATGLQKLSGGKAPAATAAAVTDKEPAVKEKRATKVVVATPPVADVPVAVAESVEEEGVQPPVTIIPTIKKRAPLPATTITTEKPVASTLVVVEHNNKKADALSDEEKEEEEKEEEVKPIVKSKPKSSSTTTTTAAIVAPPPAKKAKTVPAPPSDEEEDGDITTVSTTLPKKTEPPVTTKTKIKTAATPTTVVPDDVVIAATATADNNKKARGKSQTTSAPAPTPPAPAPVSTKKTKVAVAVAPVVVEEEVEVHSDSGNEGDNATDDGEEGHDDNEDGDVEMGSAHASDDDDANDNHMDDDDDGNSLDPQDDQQQQQQPSRRRRRRNTNSGRNNPDDIYTLRPGQVTGPSVYRDFTDLWNSASTGKMKQNMHSRLVDQTSGIHTDTLKRVWQEQNTIGTVPESVLWTPEQVEAFQETMSKTTVEVPRFILVLLMQKAWDMATNTIMSVEFPMATSRLSEAQVGLGLTKSILSSLPVLYCSPELLKLQATLLSEQVASSSPLRAVIPMTKEEIKAYNDLLTDGIDHKSDLQSSISEKIIDRYLECLGTLAQAASPLHPLLLNYIKKALFPLSLHLVSISPSRSLIKNSGAASMDSRNPVIQIIKDLALKDKSQQPAPSNKKRPAAALDSDDDGDGDKDSDADTPHAASSSSGGDAIKAAGALDEKAARYYRMEMQFQMLALILGQVTSSSNGLISMLERPRTPNSIPFSGYGDVTIKFLEDSILKGCMAIGIPGLPGAFVVPKDPEARRSDDSSTSSTSTAGAAQKTPPKAVGDLASLLATKMSKRFLDILSKPVQDEEVKFFISEAEPFFNIYHKIIKVIAELANKTEWIKDSRRRCSARIVREKIFQPDKDSLENGTGKKIVLPHKQIFQYLFDPVYAMGDHPNIEALKKHPARKDLAKNLTDFTEAIPTLQQLTSFAEDINKTESDLYQRLYTQKAEGHDEEERKRKETELRFSNKQRIKSIRGFVALLRYMACLIVCKLGNSIALK